MESVIVSDQQAPQTSTSAPDAWRALIVRVKRKRMEACSDDVIVIEADSTESNELRKEEELEGSGDMPRKMKRRTGEMPLMNQFSNLAVPSTNQESDHMTSRRLLLRRVDTIDPLASASGAPDVLSTNTIEYNKKRTPDEVDGCTIERYKHLLLNANCTSFPIASSAPTARLNW